MIEATAFFKQKNRHALADTLARHVFENTCALGVKRQMHCGFLVLRIKSWLGVG